MSFITSSCDQARRLVARPDTLLDTSSSFWPAIWRSTCTSDCVIEARTLVKTNSAVSR
ncbi:MAG: hypothetical protein H7Z39_20175 [Burkholderiaceae bacterium]|nr:hypothetical protein [Burkholderiaceae bacterium]